MSHELLRTRYGCNCKSRSTYLRRSKYEVVYERELADEGSI
jgi:hypothetical protein